MPRGVFTALRAQFDSAPQVDPIVLKQAAVVLETFHNDALAAAAHHAAGNKADPQLHAAHAANALATEKCQTVLAELANELGISLSTSRGQQR